MRRRISPVVLNIIIVNVLVFVFIQLNFEQFAKGGWAEYILLFKTGVVFDVPRDLDFFMPLQLVTSMFAHTEIFHIFFNMFTLYSIGSAVEIAMGSRRFAVLYLFSGLFGTIMTALLDPSPNPVLGASGALFGVFAGFAYYYPDMRLSMMFIPIGFRAKRLLIGISAISIGLMVFNLLVPAENRLLGGISHFGHMAGLAGGLLYLNLNKILGIFTGKR